MPVTLDPLGEDDPVPDFELPRFRGGRVRLSDVLDRRDALIVFYRGGRCPTCSRLVRSLADRHEAIRSRGAEVLAIARDRGPDTARAVERAGLPFPVLYDARDEVAACFGLARDPEGGASGRFDLSVPTVFLVDRDGRVAWRHVGAHARDRPDVDDILRALRDACGGIQGDR